VSTDVPDCVAASKPEVIRPIKIQWNARCERLALLVSCPKCGGLAGEPCVKLTSRVVRTPCLKPHVERRAAAEAGRTLERAEERTGCYSERGDAAEIHDGLRQQPLAKTIEYAMVALERRAQLVKRFSHAGPCPSCEDGEIWTSLPFWAPGDEDEAWPVDDEVEEIEQVEVEETDAERLRFSDQREEDMAPEPRSLGTCPVCNGIAYLDCGYGDCEEWECKR